MSLYKTNSSINKLYSDYKDIVLPLLNNKIDQNQDVTYRWVDFVENYKYPNCTFCGSFNSISCIICGKCECDPKPDISLVISKSENVKELKPYIDTLENYYNDAVKNKDYDKIASIIQIFKDNNIKYICILEDQYKKIYPTYKNLLDKLKNAILNHDLEIINELITMGIVPTEEMLYDIIRINIDNVFTFDKEILYRIAEIILREFVQIKKSLVIEAIINTDIYIARLFIEKSILCEEIYSEIAGLGYLPILKYLDSKNCPKNYYALFNIAYNKNISFSDKINVMEYLITNGCNTLPTELINPKIFDIETYNWIELNCNKDHEIL